MAPVNYYGFTKAEAEKVVAAELPESVIIRVSLVLGFPLGEGCSFLSGLDARLRRGEGVGMSIEEVRTPIDVHTLASCCLELAVGGDPGIIHLASTDAMTRYEIARLYVRMAGYDESLVTPAAARPVEQVPRHVRGVLRIDKAQKHMRTPLLSVASSLENILKRMNR